MQENSNAVKNAQSTNNLLTDKHSKSTKTFLFNPKPKFLSRQGTPQNPKNLTSLFLRKDRVIVAEASEHLK